MQIQLIRKIHWQNYLYVFNFLLLFLFLLSCGKAPAFSKLKESNEIIEGLGKSVSTSSVLVVFPDLEMTAEIVWSGQPAVDELQEFILLFKNKNDKIIDPPFEFQINPSMPSMGHGTSPVEIKRFDVGLFKVSEVYFSMPGHWILPIEFIHENKIISSAKIDLHL